MMFTCGSCRLSPMSIYSSLEDSRYICDKLDGTVAKSKLSGRVHCSAGGQRAPFVFLQLGSYLTAFVAICARAQALRWLGQNLICLLASESCATDKIIGLSKYGHVIIFLSADWYL